MKNAKARHIKSDCTDRRALVWLVCPPARSWSYHWRTRVVQCRPCAADTVLLTFAYLCHSVFTLIVWLLIGKKRQQKTPPFSCCATRRLPRVGFDCGYLARHRCAGLLLFYINYDQAFSEVSTRDGTAAHNFVVVKI